MTHNELVEAISQDTNISKTLIKTVLASLGETVCGVLADKQDVTIQKIGKFSTKVRAARTGKNPRTGAILEIKAKNVPKITIAKALKDAALVAN